MAATDQLLRLAWINGKLLTQVSTPMARVEIRSSTATLSIYVNDNEYLRWEKHIMEVKV